MFVDDVCCDECGHGPFPNSIYWIGEACTDACREKPWNEKSCFRFKYALCHACTPETAQIDWTSPLVGVYGNDRIEFHTPEEADEFYGSLTVENSDFAMDLSNHAAVASEVRTAKALLLPCHMPDLANSPDRYFSRLLVSKEWIALNAPNIWALDVTPLQMSEDGKYATRELVAHMKVDEDEWHLSPDEWTNEHSMKDMEYDFPILDAKDIFARQRHLDKMRRREEACIRELDGDAAIEYRERKAQMARERQCR